MIKFIYAVVAFLLTSGLFKLPASASTLTWIYPSDSFPPTRTYDNVTLMTGAKVVRLHTNESGREVTAVETEIAQQKHLFSSDLVVVSCGTINSAALLLRSASDRHPHGLANSSDQVGRVYPTNIMRPIHK